MHIEEYQSILVFSIFFFRVSNILIVVSLGLAIALDSFMNGILESLKLFFIWIPDILCLLKNKPGFSSLGML